MPQIPAIIQHSSPSHVGHFMHQHMTFSCLTDHRAPRGVIHFEELPLNTSSLTAAVWRALLLDSLTAPALFTPANFLPEVTWLNAGVALQRGRKKAAWVETVTRYENVPKRLIDRTTETLDGDAGVIRRRKVWVICGDTSCNFGHYVCGSADCVWRKLKVL